MKLKFEKLKEVKDIFNLKKIFKSKTLSFSWLTILIGVLESNYDLLSLFFTQEQFGAVIAALGGISALIRVFTNKSLSEK